MSQLVSSTVYLLNPYYLDMMEKVSEAWAWITGNSDAPVDSNNNNKIALEYKSSDHKLAEEAIRQNADKKTPQWMLAYKRRALAEARHGVTVTDIKSERSIYRSTREEVLHAKEWDDDMEEEDAEFTELVPGMPTHWQSNTRREIESLKGFQRRINNRDILIALVVIGSFSFRSFYRRLSGQRIGRYVQHRFRRRNIFEI